MENRDGTIVVSPSDLVGYLACPHLTQLEVKALRGELERPSRDDPMLELLRDYGNRHERDYHARLTADGAAVVDIDRDDDGADDGGGDRHAMLRALEQRTAAAMRGGADVIYQATFYDETGNVVWRGHADFLRRVQRVSALGEWSYEPEDTKLAGVASAGAVIQLSAYAEQVARLQGVEPSCVHVVTGDSQRTSIDLSEVSAYYRRAKQRLLDALANPVETYPTPVGHCAVCRWADHCERTWERDDHLNQVAFLTTEQARRLQAAGVPTMTALASSPDDLSVPGISAAPLQRLRVQARLQKARQPGQPPPVEHVLPVTEAMGLASLPEPDPGDVFYDIEGHPYAARGGLEYLHGLGWEDAGELVYEARWAHTSTDERRVFERLIDVIVERRARHPQMHVYHYAPYETSAITRLMGRYGTREHEVDDLLRNGVFVDLYRAVRQGLRIGSPSYSIKKLEPLYMPPREGEIGHGGSSAVEYERWLHTADLAILEAIRLYNRDDVESTWRLRRWLEQQRAVLIERGIDVPRFVRPHVDPAERIDEELQNLIERLTFDRGGEAA